MARISPKYLDNRAEMLQNTVKDFVPKPGRLMDQVREVLHFDHYAYFAEKLYLFLLARSFRDPLDAGFIQWCCAEGEQKICSFLAVGAGGLAIGITDAFGHNRVRNT